MRNKLLLILLTLILLAAAFLRLYSISSYMQFLGDEGRDVLVAKDILKGELTLLGPRSSAGDFYMGPFYYYLIAPFLLLFNYDPVGPAIMVALFGVASVFLIYKAGARFFNREAGIFAAALYSASPLVLTYSHSSWNPNVLPFFALLLMYAVYLTEANKKNWKFYVICGIILGICLQLHYLSLFLAVTLFIYLLLSHQFTAGRIISLNLIKNYLGILTGTVISLSPFIFFEIRHGFLNTNGILSFIGGNSVSYSANTNFFQTIAEVFFRIFARLILNYPVLGNAAYLPQIQQIIWGGSAMILALASIILLFLHKNKSVALLLSLWLFISLLLFGVYKKEIHDYLFTFIFPLPFLLVGNLLGYIYHFSKSRFLFPALSLLIFFAILIIYFLDIPFRYEPNNQRDQVKKISRFIISKTNNKHYNFALLSGGNSDHAYRYYFDILGNPPVYLENLERDPKRESATRQLFIVCEDIPCNPIGHPLHDIAAFGRAEIVGEWNVSVVKVYKLIRYSPPVAGKK